MRKQKIASGGIYHIYNRGVEKRSLFLDDRDYNRFIYNLAVFNDIKPALNSGRKSIIGLAEKEIKSIKQKRPLVNIIAFCLMSNHYHLLLEQEENDGISKFMNKLGVGYANYFNLKYQRVGPLFQGKFKSVLVNNEAHFLYIPHYIHLNPLDLVMPSWREGSIKETKKALNFLNSYKWSSYGDYTDKTNFQFLDKHILFEYFNGAEGYVKEFQSFINDLEFSTISDPDLLID